MLLLPSPILGISTCSQSKLGNISPMVAVLVSFFRKGSSNRVSWLGLLVDDLSPGPKGELMVTEDSEIPVSCLQQLLAVAS